MTARDFCQMTVREATFASPVGPDTHDDPYKTGARPRNPFLCRKTILETIKSISISDWNKYTIH